MATYVVKDWQRHFEKAQLRAVATASWVPLPVKHDGKGFRRIMAMTDGIAIYGTWVLIVQVAAKCPVRGVLADEDGPLSPDDLSIKTGCPATFFAKAFNVLSDKLIGWLLIDGCEPSDSALSLQDRIGKDKTGEERKEKSAPRKRGCPPELLDLITWWNGLRAESLVPSGAEADPPSKAILKGWTRVEASKELRDLLADREKLASEIRKAPICRDGWFRLEKLLGGTNRDGEYIARKLLDGGYRERSLTAPMPSARQSLKPASQVAAEQGLLP